MLLPKLNTPVMITNRIQSGQKQNKTRPKFGSHLHIFAEIFCNLFLRHIKVTQQAISTSIWRRKSIEKRKNISTSNRRRYFNGFYSALKRWKLDVESMSKFFDCARWGDCLALVVKNERHSTYTFEIGIWRDKLKKKRKTLKPCPKRLDFW